MEYETPKSEVVTVIQMEILCLSNGYGGSIDDLDREDVEIW